MGKTIGASGDRLYRESNLPNGDDFTICGWCRVTTNNAGTTRGLFLLSDANHTTSPTDFLWLGWNSSNQFGINASGSTQTFSGSPTSASGWFFWAITSDGTDIDAYWADLFDADLQQNGSPINLSGPLSFTEASIQFGSNADSEYVDGDIAVLKMWDHPLTETELDRERWFVQPRRLASLRAWWPLIDVEDTYPDYGPNGYDLSEAGTVTNGAGPFIWWGNRGSYNYPLWIPWKVEEDGNGDSTTLHGLVNDSNSTKEKTLIHIVGGWDGGDGNTTATLDGGEDGTRIVALGDARNPGRYIGGTASHWRKFLSSNNHGIQATGGNFELDGLVIVQSSGGTSAECIRIYGNDVDTNLVRDCLLWCDAFVADQDCIYTGFDQNAGTINIENCIIYGAARGGINSQHNWNSNSNVLNLNVNSCTIYNTGNDSDGGGISIQTNGQTIDSDTAISVHNTIVMEANNGSCFNDEYNGASTNTWDVSYSIDDDGSITANTDGGTGNLESRTATTNTSPGVGDWVIFTNLTGGSEDFRLVSNAENDAEEMHAVATAHGLTIPDKDVIGTTRPQSTNYDCGAFEIIVSGTPLTAAIDLLLEHLIGIDKDSNVLLEHTISFSTAKNELLEHLIEVSDGSNLIVEHLINPNATKNILVELIGSLSESKNPLLEHLVATEAGKNILTEFVLGLTLEDVILLEHLVSINKNNNVPLEHIGNISPTKNIILEFLREFSVGRNELVEHLIALNPQKVHLIEHLIGLTPQRNVVLEHLVNLNPQKVNLLEHLIGLNPQRNIVLEHLIGLSPQRNILLEHLANFSDGKNIPLEHLISLNPQRTALLEHLIGLDPQRVNLLEHLLNIDVDKDVLLEHLLESQVVAPNSVLLEFLGSLSDGKNIILEHLSNFSTQKNILLEYLIGIDSDSNSILEHLLGVSSQKNVVLEHLYNISADKDILLEHLIVGILTAPKNVLIDFVTNRSINKNVLLEHITNFSTQNSIVLEHLIGVGSQADIVLEHLVTSTLIASILVEFSTNISIDKSTLLEHLYNISVDNNVLVEMLLAAGLVVPINIPLEHLASAQFNNNIPLEHLANVGLITKTTPLEHLQGLVKNGVIYIEHPSLISTDMDVLIEIVSSVVGVDPSAPQLIWNVLNRGSIWNVLNRGSVWNLRNRGTNWTHIGSDN